MYKDSCAEFFFSFVPDECSKYMNIEGNAMAVLLIEIGESRHDRARQAYDPKELMLASQVTFDRTKQNCVCWHLRYFLPAEFIARYFGSAPLQPGHTFTANFYKCGEEVPQPHFGTWNKVGTPKADFHRPEYFGKIVLGNK